MSEIVICEKCRVANATTNDVVYERAPGLEHAPGRERTRHLCATCYGPTLPQKAPPRVSGKADPAEPRLDAEKKTALNAKEGVKFDAGKVKFSLVPTYSYEQIARVFYVGASKYEEWNWLKGMDWTRVSDAMERHFVEWKKGMSLDPETALRHLAQIAWGATVLLEYERLGIGKDDRVMPTRVADLQASIRDMQGHRDRAVAARDALLSPEKVVSTADHSKALAKAEEKVRRLNAGLDELQALLKKIEGCRDHAWPSNVFEKDAKGNIVSSTPCPKCYPLEVSPGWTTGRTAATLKSAAASALGLSGSDVEALAAAGVKPTRSG